MHREGNYLTGRVSDLNYQEEIVWLLQNGYKKKCVGNTRNTLECLLVLSWPMLWLKSLKNYNSSQPGLLMAQTSFFFFFINFSMFFFILHFCFMFKKIPTQKSWKYSLFSGSFIVLACILGSIIHIKLIFCVVWWVMDQNVFLFHSDNPYPTELEWRHCHKQMAVCVELFLSSLSILLICRAFLVVALFLNFYFIIGLNIW